MIDWNDNISDEMLAAYLDGNVNMEESSLIQDQIGSDSMLSEVIDIVNDINHLGLTMSNENLIMNSMDGNLGMNNDMDIISSPLLTISEYNDGFSQFDTFNNDFNRDSYDNELDSIFDDTLKE